jgi:hypothetical protein
MTYAAFILLFWPIIAVEVLGVIVLPVALIILLVQLERRRLVRRMHRMRRTTPT